MSEKTTAELEIKVSNGKVRIIKVEASKLSLEDEFMKHQPVTDAQQNFKEMINQAIEKGLKDFWRPKYDPAFSEIGRGICYKPGKNPAVGKSYDWWENAAKKFYPKRKSRLGTKFEYIAFLAVLIKMLIESGWTVSEAWYAVCDNPSKLGHYWNADDAKNQLECTGSREVCGFFDLANTVKILADDYCQNRGFWIASGTYKHCSYFHPLFRMSWGNFYGAECKFGVGWLVFEDFTTDH